MSKCSAGFRFRAALAIEKPLQIAGCINAYTARLAEQVGFKALYLSGGGVAAASLGVPDLAITTINDVLTDVGRITDITDTPLLVDVDTGFGSSLNIARTVKSMSKFGAAAIHIEDQTSLKRCGHLSGKKIVTTNEMVGRIKAAVDARSDPDFIIMARTDALASEGLQSAIDRACAYVEAGADMIFPEAVTELRLYQQFADTVNVPILANITEFGKTPLYSVNELKTANVSMVLYPLSAFRAMSAAALKIYQTIRHEGTQQSVINNMQTRNELYDCLDYYNYEQKLNASFTMMPDDNNE
ncbi:MAG: methylisocitrate lyase [Nitrosomonas sp.]|nr:methylisocitrate lyase [Nitrosomonas sp.]